jgi:hypothetical protein
MPAHAPHFGAATDLLLVIGVAALVLGLGCLILGLSEADPIPNPKTVEIEITSTRAADVALDQFSPSSQRMHRDPGGPPIATARSQSIVNGIEAGAARTYLLEMSARLRRTTLGADQAMRDAVSADFNPAYAWLGLGDSAQEQVAKPTPRHHVTPQAPSSSRPRSGTPELRTHTGGNFTRRRDDQLR